MLLLLTIGQLLEFEKQLSSHYLEGLERSRRSSKLQLSKTTSLFYDFVGKENDVGNIFGEPVALLGHNGKRSKHG